MGLGKTITVVSLIANTMNSASNYVGTIPIKAPAPAPPPPPKAKASAPLTAAHFAGSVWGMPDISDDDEDGNVVLPPTLTSATPQPPANLSAKAKSKLKAAEQKTAEELSRAARIKVKSRATLIVCPLSTVVNWEDQFKEHWNGEVLVVGGATGVPIAPNNPISTAVGGGTWSGTGVSGSLARGFPSANQNVKAGNNTLKVYVYHGTSRRPDPAYLADFDAVITTYSTLA